MFGSRPRATCTRGRPAGERIAGYIRDAAGEQRQASGRTTSEPNDRSAMTPPRRPVPTGGHSGRGRPPAQRRGGGRGSRWRPLVGLGVVLVVILLLAGLCTAIRDRVEPSTAPAAPTGSPNATPAEVQEQPQRPEAPPSSLISDQPEQPQPGPQRIGPADSSPTDCVGERSAARRTRTGRERCGRHRRIGRRYGTGRCGGGW